MSFSVAFVEGFLARTTAEFTLAYLIEDDDVRLHGFCIYG